MTNYTVRSMVCIAPVGIVEALVALGDTIGFSGGWSIPLSSDGTGEPTHYGFHATSRPFFMDLLKGFSPMSSADAKSAREALVEPAGPTEQEAADAQAAEALLVKPSDPEHPDYQADLEAYHDALTAIRAPLHAKHRAIREYHKQREDLEKLQARASAAEKLDLALEAGLSRPEINAIRNQLIVSGDPEVDGEVLYGRAHLDWIASQNGLAVIEQGALE